MLKKTIKFTDCNGQEREEDFYFNLSQAEVMKIELSTKGGLTEHIRRIIAAKDTATLIEVFEDLILKSYGEKSADGREFLKEDETGYKLCNRFKQTEAYSNLFMELATDADAAAIFVNGIIAGAIDQSDTTHVEQPALKK